MSDHCRTHSYPRPDFERTAQRWECLNGDWNFAFDDEDVGIKEKWFNPNEQLPAEKKRKIVVPYVYQTAASGINEQQAHQIVWYQKQILDSVSKTFPKLRDGEPGRLFLNFGAVDYEATVWLGGVRLGSHRGGHVPFEFDVTDILDEGKSPLLTVRVWDAATDLTQPRGKQYWGAKPEGIFYTPSTGIWQPVWIEHVPTNRILNSSHGTVLRSNSIDSGELEAEIVVSTCQESRRKVIITASLAGIDISQSEPADVDNEKCIVRLTVPLRLTDEQIRSLPKEFTNTNPLTDSSCWYNGLGLWTPENPILYDLSLALHDSSGKIVDQVKTYIGVRSLNWTKRDGTFRLNAKPYFQALVLDQGYWPETNMTQPTATSCKEDIKLSKKMGFNGCRKHQKVEDPRFLYWADKLGYLVWGEMANGYEFSSQYVQRFDNEWVEAVQRDINHPCIVTWTPVNETWGYPSLSSSEIEQNHIRALYYMTKTLDPTRSINDNCGWEHVCTDLTTFHDYSDGPELGRICNTLEAILQPKGSRAMFIGGASHQEGAPILCTEFGGVNIAPQEGAKEIEGSWGYTTASDADDLLDRVRKLMLGVVQGGHCCGFVYTQLTDIEQETNGLYTFDRKEKLPADRVKQIIDDVRSVYLQSLKSTS